ncbi:hypothetical protein COCON_G00229960 [Conger conger]|uniref:Uncharacterized protein n=1 Tax=Conger conger TaxID=82655 RepID=A0A9Q1HJL5_CONCO|nr:hypothetical protein COCON_G00229960 [Conger conger]
MRQLALLQRLDEDGGLLVQLPRAAPRRGRAHRVPELGVVHRVHPFLLGDDGHEAVAPLDLLGHVGGAGLRGDAGGLHHALQDDDDLQVAALQLHGGEVVEGAVAVDGVADDERRQQEDAVARDGALRVDVDLVDGDDLALGRGGLAHHLQAHGRADDHALAQVAHAEHEAEAVVAHGDDGVPAEDERLGPPVRLRRLHEDAAQHDGVDDQPHDVLQDQHADGRRALLRDHAPAEADGHLHLDGEQEGRAERPAGGRGSEVRPGLGEDLCWVQILQCKRWLSNKRLVLDKT